MTTTEEVTTTEEETTTEEVTTEETTTETTIPERTITIHKIAPAAASATQSEDGIYTIQYDPHDMAGVTFGIYDADGNLVETVITDENGYAESSILNGDYYTVQEMQTVSGYVMSTEPYVIDFTTNEGDTANLEITNDIIRCQIHLSKQLEGNAGDITMVQFGLYTAQDIPLLDGTVVPSDSCIGIANAQEDGTILFEDTLPAGNYYVKELATADGYVLSDTIYPVEIIYPEAHGDGGRLRPEHCAEIDAGLRADGDAAADGGIFRHKGGFVNHRLHDISSLMKQPAGDEDHHAGPAYADENGPHGAGGGDADGARQPIAHGGAHHAQDQVTDQAAAAAHELAGDPADEGA